jgi:hypothetical protein
MFLSQNFTGFKFLVILFFLSVPVMGQTGTEKITVIPGEEYKAGAIHRFFFGNHWRDLWITPIDVPVLDPEKFSGGLIPVQRGGGMQTKSLRFRNNKGVEYKFRSINKDPSKALPVELRETLASDLVQDQTSSANPLAPLIVAPILRSLGIMQAEPFLAVMKDSKRLGQYQDEFGGVLGIMEIHPDEFDDEEKNFAGADKVAGTVKLIERLEKDNDEFVKSSEYLKARLADLLMGDWDRHIDQWRWARFTEGDKKYWYPIPRDRDQAFAKFDGVFPWLSAMAVTQLEHFSGDYTDIEGMTWAGRYTDRRFLHQLTKSEWDSVTFYVMEKVTDSVIISAVKSLPETMFELEGEELINDLISRRNKLKEVSDCFYYQTIKYVDIYFSDKDEYGEINRINNREVEVKVFDLDKNKIPKEEPLYHRIFNKCETNEIRLIMNGGDDKVVVKGDVDESINIYVTGDEGKDTLIDSSIVKGYFLSVTPIPDAEQKTFFYDKGEKTVFITGSSTSVKKEKYEFAEKVETPRDWGHDWRFAPWFNINPDDGLFLGGGAILYEFGFRRRPYIYRMELTGGYATRADRFRLRYTAEYNPSLSGIRFLVDIRTSGLEVINFYGFGNETSFNRHLKDDDYYKVKQQESYIKPAAEFFINANSRILAGLRLKYTDTDSGNRLFELNPYGTDNMLLFNLNAEYIYDSRQSRDFPVSGFYFTASGSYFPPLKKDQSSFYKSRSEARIYFSNPALRLSSMAVKVGGEKIWGRYPFFESAFLGGESSLRGYDRNRFAGDASLYASAELRFFLAQTKVLIPVYFGLTALADGGKIFYNNQASDIIRTTFGGGIWLSFLKPEYLFTFYIAHSPEDTGFYFNLGFLY